MFVLLRKKETLLTCCRFLALTWQVIGSLIDLDCSEDFIKTLLQNVWKPNRAAAEFDLLSYFFSIFVAHLSGSMCFLPTWERTAVYT